MPRIKNSCLDIKERFPCREKVIHDLERRLANIRWPFMLINGAHSTGKSSITRALLESLNIPFSWNNCLEISSLKNLQIKILYDIGYLLNPKDLDEEELPTRVASNEIFIEEFRSNLERLMAKLAKSQVKKTPNGKRSRSEANLATPTVDRFFIVLDNYDKLVDSNISILPALNEIHEMLKKDISVITIMVSTIYYDRLVSNFSNIPRPLNFTFPGFDAKSFPLIINKLVSEERDDEYIRHCEHVTQTLSFSISDLNKLSFICEQSFLDQINQTGGPGEIVSLRKFFTAKADYYAHKAITLQNHAKPTDSTSSKLQSNFNEMEQLPKAAKYLLLAAFLASNNTKASDKKLFVIASDKRKVARNASRKETVVTGPKLFTLERLIHIYEALVYLNEENEGLKSNMLNQPTNQLLAQIETLVSLKLLIKVNSVTIIFLSSLIKYQMSDFVTIEFIDSLANSLGIKLNEYMC